MSRSPLDFASLLLPIPGDDPAGSPVPFEVRHQLEEHRKEENPDEYAPDDPLRPEQAKRADWHGIVQLAQETLTHVSKDLLVAARLVEALVRLHGFAGLRDGLRLLRELVEQCWERLRPPLEDGDLEVRAAPFCWLDDPDRGARFPVTLRTVPLVLGAERPYGWLDWRRSQTGAGPVTREEFEKAVLTAPPEHWQATAAEIGQSLEELDRLTASLTRRMGPAAPGLTALRRALEDCQELSQQILQRQCPLSTAAVDMPNGQPVPTSASVPATPAPGTRAEVYRQLAQAAAVLRGLEPHSPVPYLLERVVKWGSLPFPDLIKELIRDGNVLSELNRELDLRAPCREVSE